MALTFDDKEALYNLQRELLKAWPVLVQISLVMPGGFMNYSWGTLFQEACENTRARLGAAGFVIGEETCRMTGFGPVCLLALKTAAGGSHVKRMMVELEETAPRGRLWDIDVVTPEGPVDRADLGLRSRKCLVCDEEAHVCRLSKAHKQYEVAEAARAIISREGR